MILKSLMEQALMEQVPRRDVKIVMSDINAKCETNQTGREEVMGRRGERAKINENGERWAGFCQVNDLVIGRTLFPHKKCHKRTWISPYGVTENQKDSDTEDHCGTEYRVAVLLVRQLYRFRKGL